MALKKTIQLKNNFEEFSIFENSYIKITNISGDKNKISCSLSFLKDKNKEFISSSSYQFTPSLDGDNFIKQAYLHLKTLPEFADAVDC